MKDVFSLSSTGLPTRWGLSANLLENQLIPENYPLSCWNSWPWCIGFLSVKAKGWAVCTTLCENYTGGFRWCQEESDSFSRGITGKATIQARYLQTDFLVTFSISFPLYSNLHFTWKGSHRLFGFSFLTASVVLCASICLCTRIILPTPGLEDGYKPSQQFCCEWFSFKCPEFFFNHLLVAGCFVTVGEEFVSIQFLPSHL